MSIVNDIWWVIDILKELIGDSISYEEAQNLQDSLFFGEKYDKGDT